MDGYFGLARNYSDYVNYSCYMGTNSQMVFPDVSAWGVDGFLQHTRAVSAFYRGKRDVFEAAMRRHLEGLAEWTPPQSGLFFWCANPPHPRHGRRLGVMRTQAFENGVLALPGTVFLPNGRKTAYVRAAFSFLGEEQVEEALRRLRATILDARAEAGAA
ncbi:pyridoxal phosphate-dependent transferase [Mycena galopus ATCC 62051]|nr:pyridoxal phosphate-dependent transferase [Mycena galopus ATCC 62051]